MSRQDSGREGGQTPDLLFSIGDVAEMTGLSEATLRVWERRYQFPQTARSAGGHRLFSQRTVIQLQWVKLQMDEGMRTSRAIEALHHLPRSAAIASALRTALPVSSAPPEAGLVALQRRLYYHLLAYDATNATKVLEEATASYSFTSVVLDVIRPTLSAIGDAWHEGQTDVTTEHYATNYLRHHLLNLMHSSPDAFQVQPVVLACAPGELHEGSLLILGALLRRLRWPVVYLGQSLPLADLDVLAHTLEPALIVFVAMSDETALALADWPRWLPQGMAMQLPLVGYGGRAFTLNPQLAEHLSGILLGNTLDEGCARIHRLLLNLHALGE